MFILLPFFLYLALLIYLLSRFYLLPRSSTVLFSNPLIRLSPLPFHNVKTVLGLLANNATCECNILVYEHNIFPEGRVCGRRLWSKGKICLHVGYLYIARWNFNGKISQFPSMYVRTIDTVNPPVWHILCIMTCEGHLKSPFHFVCLLCTVLDTGLYCSSDWSIGTPHACLVLLPSGPIHNN